MRLFFHSTTQLLTQASASYPRSLQNYLRISLLSLCMVLVGCAGTETPSTAYYTLPPVQPEEALEYNSETLQSLVLEPIRMTRYLNSESIVMQLSDIEVQQARSHLWAESLDRQLERRLQGYLSAALPQTRILRDQRSAPGPGHLRLQLEVVDFQGRYDGTAVVSGNWLITDNEGSVHARQAFQVEQPLDEDGYPALVRSLAEAWETVAAELAEELARLSEESGNG